MNGMIKGDIRIHFGFVLALSLTIYLGDGEILPFIVAVILHELCHIGAIFCCNTQIRGIECGFWGIRIDLDHERMSLVKSLLISLSGSFGGLVFGLVFGLLGIREYSSLNVLLALFNLLPIVGLDGGKVVHELLTTASPVKGYHYAQMISWCTGTLMLLLGGVSAYFNLPSGDLLLGVGIGIFFLSLG